MSVLVADEKYIERLKKKFVPLVEEILEISKDLADEHSQDEDTWTGVFLSVATSCIMVAIHELTDVYKQIHKDALEGTLSTPESNTEGEKPWSTRWLKGNGQKEN